MSRLLSVSCAVAITIISPAFAYCSNWHWDLHKQERESRVFVHHCYVMWRVHYIPYGCR